MKTVRISYDPDLSLIGKTRHVDDDEARRIVFEGRGVIVEKQSDLVGETRAELVAKAKSLGLTPKGSKAALAKAIRAAEAGRTATGDAPPTQTDGAAGGGGQSGDSG